MESDALTPINAVGPAVPEVRGATSNHLRRTNLARLPQHLDRDRDRSWMATTSEHLSKRKIYASGACQRMLPVL
jgi:hypothetical protein